MTEGFVGVKTSRQWTVRAGSIIHSWALGPWASERAAALTTAGRML